MSDVFVRVPGSSANLGSGFDVFGMAVDLFADVGSGQPPDRSVLLDARHPAEVAYRRLGGRGTIWLRSNIPMGRGLGFSGAVRVAGAALAIVERGDDLTARRDELANATAALEGHADNVAASVFGGVTVAIDDRVVKLSVGPVIGASRFIAWVPSVKTSTDRSRSSLPSEIPLAAATHNIAHAVQLAIAIERDDPDLLVGATADRLHQDARVGRIPGAPETLRAGVEAGAWIGWLSGSGPTVGFLCAAESADRVANALGVTDAHVKRLSIDRIGVRLERTADHS